MSKPNPLMTSELFHVMTTPGSNGCLLWAGSMGGAGSCKYPRYYARNLTGGSVRGWVWREILGVAEVPKVRWARKTRVLQCDDRCVSPQHLLRLWEYCPVGHHLVPGSPHYAVYPGSGERYCRTCKFDSFSKKAYGISSAECGVVLRAQDNRCRICCEPLEKVYRDHNHESGRFRGAICRQCNTGLGMFRDNIEVLARAIKYVKDDGAWVEDLLAGWSLDRSEV